MKQYVLITGAASGVGQKLAVFLSSKYNLILNGRDYDRLIQVRNQCAQSCDVLIWQYDLGNAEQLGQDLSKWIAEKEVGIEAFIHCAGVMKLVPCKMYSYRLMEDMFRVNVFSAALITKVISSKKVNGDYLRSVVFISSNISNRGAAAMGIYSSSKSALDGLMRSLAVELAPRVRVNSVLPGGMPTEMTKEIYENENIKKAILQNTPLGIGSPEKLISIINLLISSDSDWITGQQFVVDGGRTIDITER